MRSNSAPTELMFGSRGARLLGSSAMLTRKTSHRTLTSAVPAARNLGLHPYRRREASIWLGDKGVDKQVDKGVFLCTYRWMGCV